MSAALKLINCVFKPVLLNEKTISSYESVFENKEQQGMFWMSVLCFYYRINRWTNNKIKGKTITNLVLCTAPFIHFCEKFFFHHGHSYEHPEIKLRHSVNKYYYFYYHEWKKKEKASSQFHKYFVRVWRNTTYLWLP